MLSRAFSLSLHAAENIDLCRAVIGARLARLFDSDLGHEIRVKRRYPLLFGGDSAAAPCRRTYLILPRYSRRIPLKDVCAGQKPPGLYS